MLGSIILEKDVIILAAAFFSKRSIEHCGILYSIDLFVPMLTQFNGNMNNLRKCCLKTHLQQDQRYLQCFPCTNYFSTLSPKFLRYPHADRLSLSHYCNQKTFAADKASGKWTWHIIHLILTAWSCILSHGVHWGTVVHCKVMQRFPWSTCSSKLFAHQFWVKKLVNTHGAQCDKVSCRPISWCTFTQLSQFLSPSNSKTMPISK